MKEGYDATGVHFDFVDKKSEEVEKEKSELEEISKKLNIKIIYKDYKKEFHDKVISSFVNDYENGITPNPCALCNGIMKFQKLIEVMNEISASYIATGHYANIEKIVSKDGICRYCIKKSKNSQKDQSYMLYRLSNKALSHIIFPISDMDKKDVREIAKQLNLKVADKKDSQDVCFINEEVNGVELSYKEFIKRYEFGDDYREKIARGILKEDEILNRPYFKKGKFVDRDGKVLGFHNGIINYTIGQRKGINIAFNDRKFVLKIDAKNNQVVLGDNDDLMRQDFEVYDIVFSGISEDDLINIIDENIDYTFIAKLRYRHDGSSCDILSHYIDNDKLILKCRLRDRTRAITPGQAAVFYDEKDCVMFGGRIR